MNKFELLWKLHNGPKLIKEHKFHPTRRFRIDYFHDSGVAVEIEGGIWIRGRHTRGMGFLSDMQKYNLMAERGILLFRIPADKIAASWVLPIIETINRGGSKTYQELQKEIKDASV